MIDLKFKIVSAASLAALLGCSEPSHFEVVDKAKTVTVSYNKQYDPSDLRSYFNSESIHKSSLTESEDIFRAYKSRIEELNGNPRFGVYYHSLIVPDLDDDKQVGKNLR